MVENSQPPTANETPWPSAVAPRGQPQLPDDLLAVLATLADAGHIAMLLSDLLTPQETEVLTERWHIAERLSRGEPQRAVADALAVSITTVSRGARSLKYGAGGFQLALQTLQNLRTRQRDF
jgi:Trp operon repressor